MNTTEHLLTCLLEECAEVQQAVAKALRFGLEDGAPRAETTNAQDIARELADVAAIAELLAERKLIQAPTGRAAIQRKRARLAEYMAYAQAQGTLR